MEVEAEAGITDLRANIRADPDKGFSWILWSRIDIISDTRYPISIRHSLETYLEKNLRAYWDDIFKKELLRIYEIAKNWVDKPGVDKDEYLLGLRFEATRVLMYRKNFDGEKGMGYDDES